jgi:5-methylcytosine-specific restriction enzyme subunit McrC
MDIPIQNIYFLLCYAWDKLEERELVDVDTAGSTTLIDLLARVLVNGVTHLVKRGVDRGYVAHRDWTPRIRGRILLGEVARVGRVTPVLPCEFDELSHDVLHNRIVKATLRSLCRTQGIASGTRQAMAVLIRTFADVADVELSARAFRQVQLHRNNAFYDFLLRVCRLIRDEHQMRQLFEKFVFHFYRVNTRYAVGRQNIYWQWTATSDDAVGLLPLMQTDVTLRSATRHLIVECKFTPKILEARYDTERLRSAHLYQLSAYMQNLPASEGDRCEALLVYPSTGTSLRARYRDARGRQITICTVNLMQEWPGIHEELLGLVA